LTSFALPCKMDAEELSAESALLYDRERWNMAYLSIHQTSEKWGISTRRIQTLCGEGRIPGATKIGSYWAIPDDAEKPSDARIKSGRYIKKLADVEPTTR